MRHLLCGDEASNNAQLAVDRVGRRRSRALLPAHVQPMTQQRRQTQTASTSAAGLPELRDVPLDKLAEPWTMSARGAGRRGLRNRRDYPEPWSETTRPSGSGAMARLRRGARLSAGRGPLRSAPAVPSSTSSAISRRRPAPPADRRAHAPRRAVGELLVPPPPGRLPLDRLAVGGRRVSTSRAARATARPRCAHGGVRGWRRRNPDAFEHARLKYSGPKLSFERNMIELGTATSTASCSSRRSSTCRTPTRCWRGSATSSPGGVAYVSTPTC